MIQITPYISVFTYQETTETGLQIQTLIFNHNGNNYHFPGNTGDHVHVFTESLGIYLLTICKTEGYISLNAYLIPEPDPINSLYLHNNQEIREHLGSNWEQMKPVNIVKQLIQHLY